MKTETTYADRLAELEAKHNEDRRKAELCAAIESAVPTDVWPIHIISVHSLYGSLASVHYGERYQSYGKDRMSLEAVAELAERLPPLPIVQVKDGCLSHQLKAFYESQPEEKKQRVSSELDVCPFLVKYDPNQGGSLEIEWYTELPGIGAVEISCTIPGMCPAAIGRHESRRSEHMGGFRYKDQRFTPNQATIGNVFRDETPTAQLESPIKWAAGSDEWMSSYTLFYVELGEHAPTTAADFCRQVLSHTKVPA